MSNQDFIFKTTVNTNETVTDIQKKVGELLVNNEVLLSKLAGISERLIEDTSAKDVAELKSYFSDELVKIKNLVEGVRELVIVRNQEQSPSSDVEHSVNNSKCADTKKDVGGKKKKPPTVEVIKDTIYRYTIDSFNEEAKEDVDRVTVSGFHDILLDTFGVPKASSKSTSSAMGGNTQKVIAANRALNNEGWLKKYYKTMWSCIDPPIKETIKDKVAALID